MSKSGNDYPPPPPSKPAPKSDTKPPPSPYNKNPSDGFRTDAPAGGTVGS